MIAEEHRFFGIDGSPKLHQSVRVEEWRDGERPEPKTFPPIGQNAKVGDKDWFGKASRAR